MPPDILKKMYVLRRILNPMGTVDAIEFLLDKLRQTKTQRDFFEFDEHLSRSSRGPLPYHAPGHHPGRFLLREQLN